MIITISREFGSGGRELGKRLSDALGIPCYDNEIIKKISEQNGFDEEFVNHLSEKTLQVIYPLTIGGHIHTRMPYILQQKINVAVSEEKIIENFAKEGDCIIVGRCADIILKEYNPFNIFVYADIASKLKRCRERAGKTENLSDKQIIRNIKAIDKNRKRYREFYTDKKWGDKSNYHLCINTSGKTIKSFIPPLKAYIRNWFTIE